MDLPGCMQLGLYGETGVSWAGSKDVSVLGHPGAGGEMRLGIGNTGEGTPAS